MSKMLGLAFRELHRSLEPKQLMQQLAIFDEDSGCSLPQGLCDTLVVDFGLSAVSTLVDFLSSPLLYKATSVDQMIAPPYNNNNYNKKKYISKANKRDTSDLI